MKFSLPEKEITEKTCIIVVDITEKDQNVQIGLVVDEVSEVLNVAADDLVETPKFGVSLNTEFILGMAKNNEMVRTLLNIDKVLNTDEMIVIAATA